MRAEYPVDPLKLVRIGEGVWLQWINGFRHPNKRVGINVWHLRNGEWCGGYVRFAGRAEPPGGHEWMVEQEKPLTLSPSIECHCKQLHGYIREGRWV